MTRKRVENVVVPVLAVLVAMVIGMILLAIVGNDPFAAYIALLEGSFGSTTAIARTLIKATPFILTGLAVAIAFRAGLFNIGATGQLITGMIWGGLLALNFGFLPPIVHLPLVLVAAAAGGAVWGGIAGWLKAVRGAHEVITTIMLNFIAIKFGEFLVRPGGWLQEGANPQSAPFEQSAHYPVIWQVPFNNVHFGLVVALAMAVLMWFVVDKTTLGYQIRAVGMNPDAAEYGGINVTRITIVALALGGAFAGLAGAGIAVGDPPVLLDQSEFPAIQAGFTGIAVALLGRNTFLGVIVAGILFGALDAGAFEVQLSGGLDAGVATKLIQVIQGLIVFFVGIDAFFRHQVRRLAPRGRAGAA